MLTLLLKALLYAEGLGAVVLAGRVGAEVYDRALDGWTSHCVECRRLLLANAAQGAVIWLALIAAAAVAWSAYAVL